MKKYFNDPHPLLSGIQENVPNVAPPSKKALLPITGPQMVNSTAKPVNLSTGNSSQQQLMKLFTMELATHSLTKFNMVCQMPSKVRRAPAFF